MRTELIYWQYLQPNANDSVKFFFDFCDALEVDHGTVAPETGFGEAHAVSAWASYFKSTVYPLGMFCP